MSKGVEITDRRSLQEKRERLKLQVKYHRLGLQMHLEKGLSVSSVVSKLVNKVTDDEKSASPQQDNTLAIKGLDGFGLWGLLIPVLTKVITVKATTDKSWTEIFSHVFRSVLSKLMTK